MIDENYSYPYYNTTKKNIESEMISSMKMNKRMNKKTRSKIMTAIKMVFSSIHKKQNKALQLVVLMT